MTSSNFPANWDRVERFLGHAALAQLAQKAVAIVGLGSGGGFVAQALAMSGVGRFVLIDSDVIEPANVVRHVADLRYVGKPKVEAVADLIRHRNPQAKVETIYGRLEAHKDRLAGVDLVVVGVDGEQSKYAINGVCRENGLTAIYAGVYEKGEGGDVVVIRPTRDGPCYACWADQLREDVANVTDRAPGEVELDYGMIGPDGTIAAEPGLWLHVVRVASVQADLALNELLVGQPIHRAYPANTVILANVAMEIYEGQVVQPYSAQWVNVPRDPACLVCGSGEVAEELSLEALVDGATTDEEADEAEQGSSA
jgi:molybdopterin/thiamine biosynthesis adenylyltransferase